MRNNVTITGIMGSGKSRVANTLVANGWEVFKMAAPLKKIVENAFRLSDGEIEMVKSDQIMWAGTPMTHAVTTVEGILVAMGYTGYGAKARLTEDSMTTMPIPFLGGISAEQMVYEIKDLYEELFTLKGTYRQLLQRLGTDLMRTWNPDIHIEFARVALKDKKKPQVVDDVRFSNEVDFCRDEMEAKIVWLHRPSLTQTDFHASECSISQEDADMIVRSLEGNLLDEGTQVFLNTGEWPKEMIM